MFTFPRLAWYPWVICCYWLLGYQVAGARPCPPRPDRRLAAPALRRVVTVLAADKLRGRALQTEATTAARYLQQEFRRAGLQPLPEYPDFDQSFTLYQARSQQLTAEIDGVALPREQTVLLPGQPTFTWRSTQLHPPHVMRIGPKAELKPYLDSIFAEPKRDLLVLVDPKHAQWFNSLNAHYWHNFQYSGTPPAARTTVLLLTPTLAPTSYQLSGRTQQAVLQAHNIVGMLPGHDPTHAAEQVIFGAHYDHLGIRPAVAGDSIANGANDNASGTAAVVALARYFHHRHDNARPLLFVAFTAEEVGEFGSRYFAEHLTPGQVTAMFNLEMLGTPATSGPGTAYLTGFDKSDVGTILQQNLVGTPYRLEPDPYPQEYLFYRSDNYQLARFGIPAHTISTAQITTDKRYHSVGDEVNTLDFTNLSAVVQAIAVGTRSIIAGQATPTRIAPAK